MPPLRWYFVKVYLACGKTGIWEKYSKEINVLQSYHYIKTGNYNKGHFSKYKDFILDSGIFTYLNGKDHSNVDWEKYAQEYGVFVKTNQIKNYVSLDIDMAVGLPEVERIRNKLEVAVGWKSIPVWHKSRGYDKWLEICRDYDYVCFGGFITDGISKSKYKYLTKFLSDAATQKCNVHGLGFTDTKHTNKYKFYSVDSSSWTTAARFARINVFTGSGMRSVDKNVWNKSNKTYTVKDTDKLLEFSLTEWMKYARYADKCL